MPTRILYNAQCPICNAEICHYREYAEKRGIVFGFDDLMAELVYGQIWNRPGLSRQDRMAVTLAVLCSVQNQAQLRRHIAAALKLAEDFAEALVNVVVLEEG